MSLLSFQKDMLCISFNSAFSLYHLLLNDALFHCCKSEKVTQVRNLKNDTCPYFPEVKLIINVSKQTMWILKDSLQAATLASSSTSYIIGYITFVILPLQELHFPLKHHPTSVCRISYTDLHCGVKLRWQETLNPRVFAWVCVRRGHSTIWVFKQLCVQSV